MTNNVLIHHTLKSVHEVTSHYEKALEDLKEKTKRLASEYVIKLYHILRNEEKYSPGDSRIRIIHDCSDIWTKSTIERYLPLEAKNITKRRAGMLSAQVNKEKKNAKLRVAVGGDVSLASIDENRENSRDNSVELNSTEYGSNNQKEQELRLGAEGKVSTYCIGCDEKSSKINRLQSDIELKEIQIGLLEGMISQLEGNQSSSRDSKTIITFTHPLQFEELRFQMEQIFTKTHGLGDIWVLGKLEINTLKVIELTVNATQPERTKDLVSTKKIEN